MATTAPQLIFAGLTIPPAKAINAAAAQRTLTLAADRSIIPLTYGEDRVPGQLLNALISATDPGAMLLQVLWGWGCDGISLPRLNGEALPAGATITHYTGTQTAVDTALAAAFAAQSITYTDTLEGYAYSVLKLPVVAFTGQLQISAWVRGRKVYDPRKDSTAGGAGSHRLANPASWEWSDCPALCLADWIASTAYGAGEAVAWASVPAAANANDAMIGSPAERRRVIGLTISAAANVADMAEALRAYAGCWLVPTASGMRLLPDADAAPAATYSHAAGDIAYIAPLQLPDRAAAPTVVEVVYSDLSTGERRDIPAEAALPGVGSTLPYRLSQVRLPGISRYSQALREAIERLNKLSLEGVATTLEVFDQGIVHERGDIISVTHPIGLTAATMRVVSVDMAGPGRWVLDLMRHDPLSYSDSVVTAGTIADPSRRINPGPASNVTGAAATVSAGLIRVTWAPCPDTGYDSTEVRTTNGDWGSYTVAPLYRAKATEFPYLVNTPGSYTFYIRHISNGNPSANTEAVSIVVAPGDLGGSASSYRLVLTPKNTTLTADQNGLVADWSSAISVATVVDGSGADYTPDWTYSKVDGGVVSTLGGPDGNVLTVTAWDPATVSAAYPNTVLQVHLDGNATDSSKYRRAAPSLGADVSWEPSGGKFGGAVRVTGGGLNQNARIRWGPDPSLRVAGGQWSMRCWVKLASLPDPIGFGYYFLGSSAKGVRVDKVGSSTYQWYASWGTPLGILACAYNTSSLATGAWYLVELSYCADGNLRLFIDGVLRGQSSTAIVGAYDYANNAALVFDVGCWGTDGYYGTGLDGWMDDVRFVMGPGGNESAYTPETYALPDGQYQPSAYVDVTATDGTLSLVERFTISTVTVSPSVITASLSAPTITLQADWQGVVSSFAGAASQASIQVNGAESVSLWAVVPTPSDASITCTISASRLINITGIGNAVDSGHVDLLFSRAGYANQALRLSLAKAKAAQPVVIAGGPTLLTVAGATDGSVPTASLPLSATVTALQAGTDMATSYNWVPTASAGLTASNTAGAPTVQLTAMTTGTDTGTITMTGTRTGWPPLVWVIAVTKTRLLLPAGQVVRVLPPATAYDEGSASLDVSVRYTSDGLIQTYTESTATWTTVGNWYWPTTTGIGSSHRVRINVSNTTGLTGTFNDWVSLSSDVTYTAAAATSGSSVVLAARAYIVTSSGTTVLGQGDVNLVSTFQGS